jgi:Na+/proline symporter
MDDELVNRLEDLNQKNMDLLSSYSPWALVGGFLFGIVGIWLFRKGKRETNHKVMVIGIILMVYPLFTTGALTTWAVGASLCGFAYYWKDNN